MDRMEFLWQMLIFIGFPLLSVILLSFVKNPKFLFVSPILSTLLSFLLSAILMPSILLEPEHRILFWGITIPLQFLICLIITLIVYKRKRKVKIKS